ncbi:putative C2H2 finger domain protein [Aspergillus stella-maris]|uniref:putative C2H2 finger domain protein n=1 Tax=Aspergillus stella-maris TaxID=1810926 RepID=UPI003CCCC772
MGKKRSRPTLEEVIARPWCYYCERDFDDLKILISHQKAKHFKCDRCNRRLNTAGGLSVHMSQVHKEQLTAVENALSNRSSLDVEIFGMEGVPEDVIQSHNQRVIAQFQQSEAERQAITGNPPSGASNAGGQPAKKPKTESISEMKKRLAEHKAKKAEAKTGGSSGEATPVGAGLTPNVPGFAQSPANPTAPTPAFSYPQPYAGAGSPYQATASPVYPNYSPGQPQFPPSTQFPTPAGYSPQPVPGFANTPPQLQQQQPPQISPQQNAFPPRSGSLPTPPSLPQRPAVGAPQVNAYQLQQMHMGHPAPGGGVAPGVANGQQPDATPFASSIDDLISGAAKEADQAATTATPKPEGAEEKPAKKDKSKQSRLVYSDNETSPEEKMARLPRYAFVPDRRTDTTLEELPASAVVGTIRESGAIVDPAQ